MKLFHAPYRWLPRTILPNLGHIWLDITGGIYNLWRWFPIIWEDRDWDWVYIAQVLEFKLRKHSELERDYGHHVGSQRDAQRMLICATILRRLQKDEYLTNMDKVCSYGRLAMKRSEQQKKDELELLGKLISRHLTGWWD